MLRTKSTIESEGRVRSISHAVNTAIGEQCSASGFETTYAEINSALTAIIHTNLNRELKEERNDKS